MKIFGLSNCVEVNDRNMFNLEYLVINVWTFAYQITEMIFISSDDEDDRHEHIYNVEIHVNDKETINTLFSNHVEFFKDLGYSFTFNET